MGRFKTTKDVVLLNGGYLSDKTTGKPITNKAFVAAQREAHRLALIAKAVDGKNFTPVEVDNISDIIAQIDDQLNTTQSVEFVKTKSAKVGKLTQQLQKEALAFCEAKEEESLNDHINERLQDYVVINDFEQHGLFFSSGVVKLEKIYTMKEIIANAKVVFPLL